MAAVVPVLHLDTALAAIDAEPQLVHVPRGPAGGVDDAERAVVEIHRHGEAVIGVEFVLADAIAVGLVEGLQPREHAVDFEPGAIGSEIEDVDADIAQRTIRGFRNLCRSRNPGFVRRGFFGVVTEQKPSTQSTTAHQQGRRSNRPAPSSPWRATGRGGFASPCPRRHLARLGRRNRRHRGSQV